MRKLPWLLAILAAVAGAVWLVGNFRQGGTEAGGVGGTDVVRRGTLRISLREDGVLKPRKSTDIRSEVASKIEWMVEEGKKVTKGEVLVELDKQEVTRNIEQLENQVIQGESELKSARTEELIQQDQNKTDIEKAELNLQVAKATLKKLVEGDIHQEERKRELAIEKARSDLKLAEDRLKAAQELIKEEFVSKSELEQAELAFRTAQNEVDSALLEQKLYLEYQKPIDLARKESDLNEAQRALERASKRAEAQLDAKRAVVFQRETTLKNTQQRLQREKENLAKMTLRAPTDGTVIYGSGERDWDDEQTVKVGAQVWPNMVLMTLPDPSEMSAIIQIHEADIDKVKVGMKATITSVTLKGVSFTAQVARMDAVANANSGWRGDNVKRFKVELAIDGQNLPLKPGTSSKVEVDVGEAKDVLFVPAQAIFAREGRNFVYMPKGGGSERRDVKIGRSNDTHVEIRDGLREGEAVLLYDPGVAAEGGKPPAPKGGAAEDKDEP